MITSQLIKRKINTSQKIGRSKTYNLVRHQVLDAQELYQEADLVEAQPQLSKKELKLLLSEWRSQNCLSYRQAAKQLGLSHVAVWKFENGHKKVPQRIWEAIKAQ